MLRSMRTFIRDYNKKTSFHGFAHISDTNLRFSERLFWGICCLACFTASTLLLITSYHNLQRSAVSFAVETSYLNWNTKFPTVFLCEVENEEIVSNVTRNLFGDYYDVTAKNFVKESIYFNGKLENTLKFFSNESNLTIFDLSQVQGFRGNCNDIITKCLWKNEIFNCCKYFEEILTEFGVCYGLNSVQSRNTTRKLDTFSNESTELGSLHLEITANVHIYILSEEEVPTLSTQKNDMILVNPSHYYKRNIIVKDVENDEKVQGIDLNLRQCIFPEELKLEIYPYYSYSACLVQCRKRRQIHFCNYTHNLITNLESNIQSVKKDATKLIFNASKYNCLKDNYDENIMKKCECLPSCTEMDIHTINSVKIKIPTNIAIVDLILNGLPSEKYKRYLVKDKLDIVVLFGGSFALFLGGSLLSFVELLYYFTLRLFNNYFCLKK